MHSIFFPDRLGVYKDVPFVLDTKDGIAKRCCVSTLCMTCLVLLEYSSSYKAVHTIKSDVRSIVEMPPQNQSMVYLLLSSGITKRTLFGKYYFLKINVFLYFPDIVGKFPKKI